MEVPSLEFGGENSSFPVSSQTLPLPAAIFHPPRSRTHLSKRVLEPLLSARLEKQNPPLSPPEFPPLSISGFCEDASPHVHFEWVTFSGWVLGLVLGCKDERVTLLPARASGSASTDGRKQLAGGCASIGVGEPFSEGSPLWKESTFPTISLALPLRHDLLGFCFWINETKVLRSEEGVCSRAMP